MNKYILQLNGAMTACENLFDLFLFCAKVSYTLDIYCKEDPRYARPVLILGVQSDGLRTCCCIMTLLLQWYRSKQSQTASTCHNSASWLQYNFIIWGLILYLHSHRFDSTLSKCVQTSKWSLHELDEVEVYQWMHLAQDLFYCVYTDSAKPPRFVFTPLNISALQYAV